MLAADGPGLAGRVHRSDRLRRAEERRIGRGHGDLRQHRDHRPAGQLVSQSLHEQVADHALALGAQDVERIRRDGLVGVGLEREEPDLRPVAVRDDELVVAGEGGEGGGRLEDVAPLGLRLRRLATPQQGVAAQCDDNSRDDDPRAAHRSTPPRVSIISTASSVGRRFAD